MTLIRKGSCRIIAQRRAKRCTDQDKEIVGMVVRVSKRNAIRMMGYGLSLHASYLPGIGFFSSLAADLFSFLNRSGRHHGNILAHSLHDTRTDALDFLQIVRRLE